MKIFRNYWVAWVIAILVAVGSVSFGVLTADADLLPVKSGKWVCDSAGVLSEETEQAVAKYNDSFDQDYNAYVAVATVDNMKGWEPDDYAAKLFNKWKLYGNDFMLLLDVGGKQSYLYHGSNYTDFDHSAYLDSFVNPSFTVGDYDKAVIELMPGVATYLEQLHGTEGMTDSAVPEGEEAEGAASSADAGDTSKADAAAGSTDTGDASKADASGSADAADKDNQTKAETGAKKSKAWVAVLVLVVLLALLFVVLEELDRSRYRSWYRRYGDEENPDMEFRPILPWHRPGSRWCERCVDRGSSGRRR